MAKIFEFTWAQPQIFANANIGSIRYTCGYCGTDTSPAYGWYSSIGGPNIRGYVGICTYCNKPSFVETESGKVINTTPAAVMGKEVEGLPEEVRQLYEEARACTAAGAYTSAVLTCRKILMHVAVEKKAPEGKKFIEYVDYLATEGYIPKEGKAWVDYIRTKSNEANHEIKVMGKDDAMTVITFTEMLLRLVYEFKERLPKAPSISGNP